MNSDNFILQIQASYNQFTKAEKKVADFVIKNQSKVLYMSITDLADACKVGDTSVYRFCRTMKLQGYQEFKMRMSLSQGASSPQKKQTVSLSQGGFDSFGTMAEKVMEEKQADGVSILLMNPQSGEIMAMVNVPEFDLNDPFTLNTGTDTSALSDEEKQDALNQMWRNRCINDTYEPGSTFKIITASAALEEGVVSLDDTFSCPGYRVVEDRKIRCHKVGGHGQETFVEGVMNSCNPVFIDVGLRLGADTFCDYYQQFGLLDLTGVDLPGEAGTIMHKRENIGTVELATMSFGQSFQVTPIQMAATVSSIINGGYRVTPHVGVRVLDEEGREKLTLNQGKKDRIVSEETSRTMRTILEKVVAEGSGKNAAIAGYRIGGKTATSQTLPRSANKYISSFIGFAPADDPQVLGMCIIYNPQGVYYGGTIAAPVIRDIFENILPYLGVEKE